MPEGSGGEDIVETGRRIRNMFSHPRASQVMPYAMALPVVITSHVVVARLFRQVADGNAPEFG